MEKQLPKEWRDNLVIPVIAAPMFLISGVELVTECCKNGVIGSFPAPNARPIEELDRWMGEINTILEEYKRDHPHKPVAPWAINVIAHSSYERHDAEIELIKKHQPPLVITAVGDPKPYVDAVHEYGGLVFSDVSTIEHARIAAEKGTDGLILVATGGGGHSGVINNFTFIDTVKEFWDGYTILAGGISTGDGVLAAQAAGAHLSYMGTRFINAEESTASDEYKQMNIDSDFRNLIYTDAFSGVHANFLIPSIERAGLDPSKLVSKDEIDFSEFSGDVKAWRDVWSAGQGVGIITEVESAQSIVESLEREYKNAYERLTNNIVLSPVKG